MMPSQDIVDGFCTSSYGKCPIIYMVSYIPGGAGFLPSTVLLIARFPYNTMCCKWHNVSLWCHHFLTTMLDRQHHPVFDVLVKSHEEYSCTQRSPHIVVVPFHLLKFTSFQILTWKHHRTSRRIQGLKKPILRGGMERWQGCIWGMVIPPDQ